MSETSKKPALKNLLPEQLVFLGIATGFMIYTIMDQLHWWKVKEEYSFGFLVPLFVAYVLRERWPAVRSHLFDRERSEPESSRSGFRFFLNATAFVAFLGALLFFLLGSLLRTATGPQNPASLAIALSLCGFILSGVFLFSAKDANGHPLSTGRRLTLTALFIFPALIWLLSAPLVSVAEKGIQVFLQARVAEVVFFLFEFLGFQIERKGSVLILPEGELLVEEACSGIRSLTACLFAGSFLAAVFLDRFWKKVALVALAMIFAVMTNLMRSIFLTYWAYQNGSNAIDEHVIIPLVGDIGSVHDLAGLAILVVTCIGLICMLPIFNYKLKDFDE